MPDIAQILPKIKVANSAPLYELTENDQTFPAGMYRIIATGDTLDFQRATAVDWSTVTSMLTLSSTAITLGLTPGLGDDVALTFGGVASLLWETADANANALVLALPDGTGTDVPVLVIGDQSVLNANLAVHDGIVEPTVAIWNAAGDAYVSLDAGDDAVASAKGIYFKAAADEDVEIINLSVTGTPRIFWDESADAFSFPTKIQINDTIIKRTGISGITLRNQADNADANFTCLKLTGTDSVYAPLFYLNTDGAYLQSYNVDAGVGYFKARDSGVGVVEVGRMQGAADPYFGIGRNDTGVATNAITDGLVLQMGAGTNNEAAGHGFGISVMLGNAASEVEERASLDFALVTATNGAEVAKAVLSLANGAGVSAVLDISNDAAKTTLMGLTGDYWRIGDAATSGHSLASEDDLMVSGKLEVSGPAYFDNTVWLGDADTLVFGADTDASIRYQTTDANAESLYMYLAAASGNRVPMFVIASSLVDYNLFDGITQPNVAVIEKDARYAVDTAMTAAGAGATMTKTNEFTNSVVGDIVRVTAGTNATPGWYYITTVTDASNVDLDRNWCTGAVTNGAAVLFHSFTMLSAEGICTRITDGAPSDASVEIDRDGWLILDVGQANGRLYWRANNGWHYVDATAGLSLPASEKIDPLGHKFEVGDEVKLIVDRINDDGSFHAIPHFRG